MPYLDIHQRATFTVLGGVLLLGLVALFYVTNSGASEPTSDASPPGWVFESIDEDDLQADISFRLLDPHTDANVFDEAGLREHAGPSMDIAMRESPKLVEIIENPFPNTPGTDGPLWAVLPDVPVPGAPEGVETFMLQLYNARTGDLVLEYGGPIIDGDNEWHPDFPEELRYDREDQMR